MVKNIKKKFKRIVNRTGKNIYISLLLEMYDVLYKFQLVRKIHYYVSSPRVPRGYIFILGTYNSGSTMLKQAIGLHPDVQFSQQETYHYTNSYNDLEGKMLERGSSGFIGFNRYLNRISIDKNKYDYDMNRWYRKNKFFLDKSIPLALYGADLASNFPGAKFIVIKRNDKNIIKGVLERGKAKGFATRYFGGGKFSKEFCTTQLEIFKASIEDICKKSEHCCCIVNYEDFLHNPKNEIEKIFKHIGLCEINVSHKDGRLEAGGRFMDVLPGYWDKT